MSSRLRTHCYQLPVRLEIYFVTVSSALAQCNFHFVCQVNENLTFTLTACPPSLPPAPSSLSLNFAECIYVRRGHSSRLARIFLFKLIVEKMGEGFILYRDTNRLTMNIALSGAQNKFLAIHPAVVLVTKNERNPFKTHNNKLISCSGFL